MISGIFRLIAAGLALLAAQPAFAEWHEASSDHFVIYADDKDTDLRKFAENLERYHSAMAILTGQKIEKPSPSNRVTIFVVGDQRDMRALSGSRTIGGFYIPRAGGSRAFVQEIRNQKGYPHFSTIVMLHEYAHHFLISASRFPMPRWWNEGAAEFFAAATFNDDGSLLIGRAAQHQVQRGLLLDVVVGQRAAVLELLAGEDEALLIRGDSLLVLDLGLDVLDGVRRLHVERDRLARQGLDEDLHGVCRGDRSEGNDGARE